MGSRHPVRCGLWDQGSRGRRGDSLLCIAIAVRCIPAAGTHRGGRTGKGFAELLSRLTVREQTRHPAGLAWGPGSRGPSPGELSAGSALAGQGSRGPDAQWPGQGGVRHRTQGAGRPAAPTSTRPVSAGQWLARPAGVIGPTTGCGGHPSSPASVPGETLRGFRAARWPRPAASGRGRPVRPTAGIQGRTQARFSVPSKRERLGDCAQISPERKFETLTDDV